MCQLALPVSRPARDDSSKSPQAVDFSPSRVTRTGSIRDRGGVESSAATNLHVDDLAGEHHTSARGVLSVIQSLAGG